MSILLNPNFLNLIVISVLFFAQFLCNILTSFFLFYQLRNCLHFEGTFSLNKFLMEIPSWWFQVCSPYLFKNSIQIFFQTHSNWSWCSQPFPRGTWSCPGSWSSLLKQVTRFEEAFIWTLKAKEFIFGSWIFTK